MTLARQNQISKFAVHALMIGLVIMSLFPFLWVAILGTHSREEIYSVPPPLWFGDDFWANYDALLGVMPFWTILFNSLFIAVMSTIGTVLACSLCAFGFYVYDFKGKNFVFGLMIGTMMIPPVLTIIPFFLTAKFLGILDTHFALWFPGIANAFGIFLARQYIAQSISRDLIDASRVDGCSDLRIYWSVVLPLIRPALATLAITAFIQAWNNFLGPLVIISSPDKQVLTLALRSLQSIANTPWGAVMLGTFLSMVPLLLAFVFFSRQMMAGLTAGSVKG